MARTANYYRDRWQVQFLIQGSLLTYAFEAFRTRYRSGVPVEEFPAILAGPALEVALARAKAIYTGYTEEDWFFLTQQMRRKLINDVTWIRQNWEGRIVNVELLQDLSVQLRGRDGRTISMRVPARFVICGISGASKWRHVYTGDLLAEEWLLPPRNDDATDSRYLAFRWWGEQTRTIVKDPRTAQIENPVSIRVKNEQQELASIQGIIARAEEGMYPARPGDQCRYCPVKSLCLGQQTGGLP